MSIYSALVLADGAVGYWRLGEASGTNAADAGPSGLTGTYTGSYTQGVTGALAEANTAVTLPGGTGNYVTVPHNAVLNAGDGPMTFECWVKRVGTANQGLISKTGANGPRLLIDANSFVTMSRAGTAIVKSTVALGTGWQHVVMTKAAGGGSSSTKLYIDGADVTGTVTDLTLSSTANVLLLGASTTTTQSLNGSLDEVAVYNTVLTPTQVAFHYFVGNPTLNETVTVSESRSAEPNVGQADSVTASESTAKDIQKALSDSVTASDALTDEADATVSDSVTVSESLAREVGQALSDSVTASDAASLEAGHTEADSVTATDSQASDVEVALDDSSTVSDALISEGDITLGDSVSVTDSVVTEPARLELADSVTVTDDVQTELTPEVTVPRGGWSRLPVSRALELALADAVLVYDEIELQHIEGIPTVQQRRELLALV